MYFNPEANKSSVWQNFSLAEEKEVACNFVYDSILGLNQMRTLGNSTEVFSFLYNLSVGIERLLKVAISLVEVDEGIDVDSFGESLKTHDHQALLNRLKRSSGLKLGAVHNALLKLLSDFYRDHRYGRFGLGSVEDFSRDKRVLHEFLNKYLKVSIQEDPPLIIAQNTEQIRRFMGKVIKRIVNEIYGVIKEASRERRVFAYELASHNSKSAKVLLGGDNLDFIDEERSLVEALIFLIHDRNSELTKFILGVKPIELDSALGLDYLQTLVSRKVDQLADVLEQVESCYEDQSGIKDRIEKIDLLRDPLTYLGDEEDEFPLD